MLKPSRVLLALSIVLLIGCKGMKFDPIVERTCKPMETSGYVAGVFSGQEGFAFGLTNVDTQYTKTLPFVGKPYQDHVWHLYDPAVQMIDLPPGEYRVTSWYYQRPQPSTVCLKKDIESMRFHVEAGRITCIGKFESSLPYSGSSIIYRIDRRPFRGAEFRSLLLCDYPEFGSLPVVMADITLIAQSTPKSSPDQRVSTPKVEP
jgi:hypothetical protein